MSVKWTEEQQKVISLRNRSILVSAAAGSGKTAVLVERILAMLTDKNHPVDIDRLLIMTFTRAAAGEMRERITSALESALYEDPDNEHLQRQMNLIHTAQITTIDGFCSYVIRNYFHMIGLDPGFRTAEEGEMKLLREDVAKEVLEEAYREKTEDFMALTECYAPGKTDDGLKDLVFRLYDAAMSHPFPEEWLEECLKTFQAEDVETLRKEPWMDLLWQTADEELAQAERLARRTVRICLLPDGPYLYEEALESDLQFIDRVKKAVDSRDYARTSEILGELSFARLSGKKQPGAEEAKKELAKELREGEKNILKELAGKYFRCSEEELLRLQIQCRSPLTGLVDLTRKFRETLDRKKREKNLLDFTDMEHSALEILVKKEGETFTPTQAARELSEKYEEVLIDEYQDSNYVQEMIAAMVSGWVKNRKNIFMVGDVKQSIYRFRLARPELFMEKYHRFTLEDSEEQRIDLHRNFRSRPQVLDSVNYIFRRIMGEDLGGITYDDSSALYHGSEFPEGESPGFYETELLLVEKDSDGLSEEKAAQNAQETEALAIASEIRRIVGREEIQDRGTGDLRKVEYGDIVILLRSAAGWAETFSRILESKGIPSYTVSRTGYFSASEVVTLLNYLRICDNPLQDIPLAGVLHSPLGGCSAQEMALIRSECPGGLLYESLCAFAGDGQMVLFPEEDEKERLKEKIRSFLEQLEEIRDMAAYTPVHQLILHILKITGYEQYVRALPGGSQRGANLHMLVQRAMDYEKTSYRGLFNFIRYIESLQKYEVDFGEVNLSGTGTGAVQIMTVHKSKGLEFPVVFAAGMGRQFNFQDLNARLLLHPDLGFGADAIFPDRRLIISTLQKQMIRRALKKESLGEELRVLYVALTRAREKLYITGTTGNTEKLIRSAAGMMTRKEKLLPLGKRLEARSFWSYILPALADHPAMSELYREYGIPVSLLKDSEEAGFRIRKITPADLVNEEIVQMSGNQIREEILKNWDQEKVYDEKIRRMIRERFEFRYPYEYLREMPVKLSVSELKKRSYHSEQDREEALFYEPDIIPLIPRFIAGEEQEIKGAARGTAYHRVMECLDYSRTDSEEEIRAQVDGLTEQKKMSQEEAACISTEDIMRFLRSDIGIRMGKAALDGKLYREQPFVTAVAMKEIEKNWKGGETVLVQGIIDAYFQEDEDLVLVDYKTDHVRPGEEEKLIRLYHTQLEDYARALERMVKRKVKECYIYSFALGKAVSLERAGEKT